MYRRQAQPAKVTPFQFLDGLKLLIHRFKQQLDSSGISLDHLIHRTIVRKRPNTKHLTIQFVIRLNHLLIEGMTTNEKILKLIRYKYPPII